MGMIKNTGLSMGWCLHLLFMAENLHQLEGISCIRRDQRVPILNWLRSGVLVGLVVTGRPRQSWVVGKNSGHLDRWDEILKLKVKVICVG